MGDEHPSFAPLFERPPGDDTVPLYVRLLNLQSPEDAIEAVHAATQICPGVA